VAELLNSFRGLDRLLFPYAVCWEGRQRAAGESEKGRDFHEQAAVLLCGARLPRKLHEVVASLLYHHHCVLAEHRWGQFLVDSTGPIPKRLPPRMSPAVSDLEEAAVSLADLVTTADVNGPPGSPARPDPVPCPEDWLPLRKLSKLPESIKIFDLAVLVPCDRKWLGQRLRYLASGNRPIVSFPCGERSGVILTDWGRQLVEATDRTRPVSPPLDAH
jgi:hypothetical protein